MLRVEGIRMHSSSSIWELEIFMEVASGYDNHSSGHEGLEGNVLGGDNKVGKKF